jgi:hypothetical protein
MRSVEWVSRTRERARTMSKYKVILELTTEYDPNEWNWHEIVGLYPEEELFVAVEELV